VPAIRVYVSFDAEGLREYIQRCEGWCIEARRREIARALVTVDELRDEQELP
jgi:hypothetical protein